MMTTTDKPKPTPPGYFLVDLPGEGPMIHHGSIAKTTDRLWLVNAQGIRVWWLSPDQAKRIEPITPEQATALLRDGSARAL